MAISIWFCHPTFYAYHRVKKQLHLACFTLYISRILLYICVCVYVCICVCVLVTQSHLTFCNPIDCSLLGSSVDGILQVRILEWVAIPFSRGSS